MKIPLDAIVVKQFSISLIALLIVVSSPASAFETSPEDGETGFPVDGEIVIEFDDRMEIYSVEVDISPDPMYPIQLIWSDNHRVLTIRPGVDLLPNRRYTVQVTGEDFAGHNVTESFSFETGFNPSQDRDERELISSKIIPIFIVIVIVAIIAVYIALKGIRKKKGK